MKRKKGLRGIDKGKATTSKRSVRPSRIFIYALALAALGGGGYLVYDHFRRKKFTAGNSNDLVNTVAARESVDTNTVYTSDTTTTASKKKSAARATTTANDDFPLKKGSRGARVVQVQNALIKKGAAIKADGIFGSATQGALKEQGYSITVDETTFTKLTGSTPALQVIFNPADLAKKLLSAANRKSVPDVQYILQQIKTVNEYNAVNEQYKKLLLISKTIVTHLLDYAFEDNEAARESIKVEFLRIGLRVNDAGVWSLQGIQLYKDLITIRPTVVIDAWENRLPVKGNTILGDEVKVENGMTWFRSVDRTILKVPTQDVKYA